MIALAIEHDGLVKRGRKALYFTPEPPLEDYLRSQEVNLEISPLKNPECLTDGPFDLVIASNILEHAADDSRVLAEILRVLRSDGQLIITVPLVGGWDSTYEDADISSETDRALHFGERDHVRYYGRDIRKRIENAGFVVRDYIADGERSVRYALVRGDRVFLASKRDLDMASREAVGVCPPG